jgi:hypothetical protein
LFSTDLLTQTLDCPETFAAASPTLSHAASMAKDRKERINASDKGRKEAVRADHKRVQVARMRVSFLRKFVSFPSPGI